MNRIILPAGLESDLEWSAQKSYAQLEVQKGHSLFWELELGLDKGRFSLEDEALFLAYTLAIEHFGKTLWVDFGKNSSGICLYRGKLDIAQRFVWSDKLEHYFEEKGSGDRELFCTEIFAEYLHRLAAFLPEGAEPFAFFTIPPEISPARAAQLLSKERFTHLSLERRDTSSLAKVGVCLPSDAFCTKEILQCLDTLLENLHTKKTAYRIISERFLAEEWDGLDTIIALDGAVSPLGKRMLTGFSLSGGEIKTFII